MSRVEAALSHRRGEFTLDVSLQLEGRAVTTLSGRSGSGKTTLLRCLAGLERPRAGRISLDGETWFDAAAGLHVPPHRRGVGFVTQEAHLFPHLTVGENLAYGAERAGSRPGLADTGTLVEELGIAPLLGRRVEHLSGGERQRVALGRALLARPRLLLLDEPVSALDENGTREVLEALERVLAALPVPCLYVSHDLREAARLADRMLWLDAGRVVADGPVSQVLSDPRLPFAQEEDAESVIAGRIASVDAGAGLASVAFEGGLLWIAASRTTVPGHAVRVRIRARDVSLALRRPEAISVLNILEGRVLEVADARSAASQALVRVDVGGCRLLSRVTRRSVAELGLAPGATVWALVKSAALLR